jgi:hypothetical protein
MNLHKIFRFFLVLVVLFLVFFITNQKTFGENWIPNGNTPGGIEQLLDKDSIKEVSRSVKTVMRKFIIPSQTMINLRKESSLPIKGYSNYSYSMSLWEINCKNKTIRLLVYYDYDKKGNQLDSHGYDNLNMIPIIPGSFDDYSYKVVCP